MVGSTDLIWLAILLLTTRFSLLGIAQLAMEVSVLALLQTIAGVVNNSYSYCYCQLDRTSRPLQRLLLKTNRDRGIAETHCYDSKWFWARAKEPLSFELAKGKHKLHIQVCNPASIAEHHPATTLATNPNQR